jgi:hypothetical protein
VCPKPRQLETGKRRIDDRGCSSLCSTTTPPRAELRVIERSLISLLFETELGPVTQRYAVF